MGVKKSSSIGAETPKLINKAHGDWVSKLKVAPSWLTFLIEVSPQVTHHIAVFGHLKEQEGSKASRSEGTRKPFNGLNKPGLLTVAVTGKSPKTAYNQLSACGGYTADIPKPFSFYHYD